MSFPEQETPAVQTVAPTIRPQELTVLLRLLASLTTSCGGQRRISRTVIVMGLCFLLRKLESSVTIHLFSEEPMRKLVITIWSFGFLLAPLVPMTSWALSDSEIRDSVQATLEVRHPSDSGDWWRSLGSNAPGVIMSMYRETNVIYHKIRLMDALSWYDNEEATRFMKSEAENNSNQVIKNAAIQALVKSQGMKEKTYISNVLEKGSVHSRVAAARALDQVEDPQAGQLVERFVKRESGGWAASKVERSRSLRQHQSLQGGERVEAKKPKLRAE